MSMAPADGDANDEASQLWALLGELSNQLKANREAAAVLQRQADDLKGQLHHARTGFALRRFNVDVSDEVYSSEIERLHVQLVRDNNALSYENRQLTLLARDYHHTLEQVMAKFRAFCHATQSHVLNLTSHYERQLSTQSYNHAQSALTASTASTATLEHLGSLVRRALRAAEGEDPDALSAAPLGHSTSGSMPNSSSPLQMPSFYGSGGYFGKWHDPATDAADAALERQINEQHLLEENRVLRSLLGVAEEPPIFHSSIAAPATSTDVDDAPSATDPAAPDAATSAPDATPLPPIGIVPGGLPGSEKLSLGLPRNKMRALQEREQAAAVDVAQGEHEDPPMQDLHPIPATEPTAEQEGGKDASPAPSPAQQAETAALPVNTDQASSPWTAGSEDDVEEELVGTDEQSAPLRREQQAKGGPEAGVSTTQDHEANAPSPASKKDTPSMASPRAPSPLLLALIPSPAKPTIELAPDTFEPSKATMGASLPEPQPEVQTQSKSGLERTSKLETEADGKGTAPISSPKPPAAEVVEAQAKAGPSGPESQAGSATDPLPTSEAARPQSPAEEEAVHRSSSPAQETNVPLASPEPEPVLSPVVTAPLPPTGESVVLEDAPVSTSTSSPAALPAPSLPATENPTTTTTEASAEATPSATGETTTSPPLPTSAADETSSSSQELKEADRATPPPAVAGASHVAPSSPPPETAAEPTGKDPTPAAIPTAEAAVNPPAQASKQQPETSEPAPEHSDVEHVPAPQFEEDSTFDLEKAATDGTTGGNAPSAAVEPLEVPSGPASGSESASAPAPTSASAPASTSESASEESGSPASPSGASGSPPSEEEVEVGLEPPLPPESAAAGTGGTTGGQAKSSNSNGNGGKGKNRKKRNKKK